MHFSDDGSVPAGVTSMGGLCQQTTTLLMHGGCNAPLTVDGLGWKYPFMCTDSTYTLELDDLMAPVVSVATGVCAGAAVEVRQPYITTPVALAALGYLATFT